MIATDYKSYTLSLHDALPISGQTLIAGMVSNGTKQVVVRAVGPGLASLIPGTTLAGDPQRSEEHTSELQSRRDLVCRLLLEKKKRASIPGLRESIHST